MDEGDIPKRDEGLIYETLTELTEDGLPTNRQVLQHLFYYTRESSGVTLEDAKILVSKKIETIWKNAKILTQQRSRISEKVKTLYNDYRSYQKVSHKTEPQTDNPFIRKLNNVFNALHGDIYKLLPNKEEINSLLSLPFNEIADHITNLKSSDLQGMYLYLFYFLN